VKTLVAVCAGLVTLLGVPGSAARAQAPALGPVSVGAVMPDFTLPVYQGGTITLSATG
jgi:hypothetical protein